MGWRSSLTSIPQMFIRLKIPKKSNGIYIVQLRAIDEAGNEISTVDTFIYLDYQKLEFKVIDSVLVADIMDESLYHIGVKENYSTIILEYIYSFKEVESEYLLKELII